MNLPHRRARLARLARRARMAIGAGGFLAGAWALCAGATAANGAIGVTGVTGVGPQPQELRLATTTSTENSGLLKYLLPKFEARTGYRVQVISVGTGKAMKLGEDGNVDVVLVHARPSEDKFMAEGHGVVRKDVMANDFVLVGPPSDPARVRGGKSVVDAFRKLASSGQRFLSRGDNSGTDQMEKSYWKAAGFDPANDFKGQAWYTSAGVGMGEVLTMAGQMQGYTLTDRATYGAYRNKTGLAVLVEGDPKLFNPYGIMAVNPAKSPAINHAGALALVQWITSVDGQQAIADFRVGGQQLFFPSAVQTAVTAGQP